ncbi:hypothetical protein JW921_03730, partial [Candidatus Fermentibacterales bacterium]|nr:hypothetical protein [Candidatus Fermentibacterales bacterium]
MRRLAVYLTALAAVVAGLACGARPPADMIIGTWETRADGETMRVEFRGDGTVQAQGEETQRWELADGDPPRLSIVD